MEKVITFVEKLFSKGVGLIWFAAVTLHITVEIFVPEYPNAAKLWFDSAFKDMEQWALASCIVTICAAIYFVFFVVSTALQLPVPLVVDRKPITLLEFKTAVSLHGTTLLVLVGVKYLFAVFGAFSGQVTVPAALLNSVSFRLLRTAWNSSVRPVILLFAAAVIVSVTVAIRNAKERHKNVDSVEHRG